MKWMYDKWLITCQLITWAILLILWGTIFYVFFCILPPDLSNVAIIVIAGGMLLHYFFSDSVVLKVMGARVITRPDNPKLYDMIDRLRTKAGLPMPKVAICNMPVPNAFATGRNRKHSAVVVTPSIISLLNDDELECVLAHELSHIKNYDMATMTFAGILAAIATYLVLVELISFHFEKKEDVSDWAIAIIFLLISAIIFVITLLLTRLLSRYREIAADRGSALITQNPNAMISALNKITSGAGRLPPASTPFTAFNSLFIVPAATGRFSFFDILSTHPSTRKRVKKLEKFKGVMMKKGIYVKP